MLRHRSFKKSLLIHTVRMIVRSLNASGEFLINSLRKNASNIYNLFLVGHLSPRILPRSSISIRSALLRIRVAQAIHKLTHASSSLISPSMRRMRFVARSFHKLWSRTKTSNQSKKSAAKRHEQEK